MSYSKQKQGRRIFALGFLATTKKQSALRLLWLNLKQMIERLREGDKP